MIRSDQTGPVCALAGGRPLAGGVPMIGRPCLGCGVLVGRNRSRCPTCTPRRERPDHDRAYGRAYRTLRAALLADRPPCTWCGTPATTADHLIPVALGGDLLVRAAITSAGRAGTMGLRAVAAAAGLVPACARCNARRGNALREQIRAAR